MNRIATPTRVAAALAVALTTVVLPVQGQAVPTQAEPVVISGSGVERRAFETPYAVSIVEGEELRSAGPMVNLSEALNRVPGIVANLRNNYAQDLQISSRGFGARATFGIRGLRLYTDGIPASMPDGQGQVSHFDLAGAQRIEVLRGPFSALYGANSGGVVSLVSAAAREDAVLLDGDLGSNGLWQARAGVEALLPGGWNIRAQASAFNTDGVRPHSAAQRSLGNLRLGWVGERDTVTLLANSVNQPAQDPLGLTRAQFDADPFQTAPQATQFDTRKTTAQTQGGGTWRHRFDDAGALRESVLTLYVGQRDVSQWQSIPPAAQASARHAGGVIDLARDYGGVDARLRWRWDRVGLIAGVASEQQSERRRGFENFTGSGASQILGVTGALRRDEDNRVRSSDAYLQGELELTPTLWASAGLRSGRLRLRSQDHFLGNGDDSGSLGFDYTTPVAALQWLPDAAWNVYLSAGQGFEAPTLNELAYRSDGSAGFNTALQPQTSAQLEIGAKWRDTARGLGLQAALFRADSHDEIAVLTNAGGRSSFRNVGRTRRSGAELALQWQAQPAWRMQLALTTLDAEYRDSFDACASVPCLTPADRVTVPAGNQVAGTMAHSAFAELAWRPLQDTEVGVELRYQGAMPVNDRNTDYSPAATIAALRLSHSLPLGPGMLTVLARLDNVTDRAYAGAVIVNEGNGRYFETSAARNVLLGLRWRVPY